MKVQNKKKHMLGYNRKRVGLKRTVLSVIILGIVLFSGNSCKKDNVNDFTIRTVQKGEIFEGVIVGSIPFKNYKCGFRVVNDSDPLVAYTNFCPTNMNKTIFSENIIISKPGTYRISAEITVCDENMNNQGAKFIGNEVVLNK